MLGARTLDKFELSDGWTIYVKKTIFKTEISVRDNNDEEELPWSDLDARKDTLINIFSNRGLKESEFEKLKSWLNNF
ncbi:MAG: hypothetical protein ACRCTZ_19070 [Sarcina sp.]